MQIRLTYCGQARTLAGTATESVTIPEAATAAQAVQAGSAIADNEQVRELLLTPDGKVRGNILLVVRDESCPPDEPGRLRDGDELTILTALSGG